MKSKEFKKYINDGIDVKKQLVEGLLRIQDAARCPPTQCNEGQVDLQIDNIGLYRDDQGRVIGVLGIDEQVVSRLDKVEGGIQLTFESGSVCTLVLSDSDAFELFHYFSNKAR